MSMLLFVLFSITEIPFPFGSLIHVEPIQQLVSHKTHFMCFLFYAFVLSFIIEFRKDWAKILVYRYYLVNSNLMFTFWKQWIYFKKIIIIISKEAIRFFPGKWTYISALESRVLHGGILPRERYHYSLG